VVAGRERIVHLLAGAAAGPGPGPTVLLLHGGAAAGGAAGPLLAAWAETAAREGLVLVAPEPANPEGWTLEEDGPEVLAEMLTAAARRAPMDPARLHLFGEGAGGAYALFLANRLPGAFRSVAVHAGALPGRAVAPAPGGPPILMIAGERDARVPPRFVTSTARALAQAGHAVEVVELEGQGHALAPVGPWLSALAWAFLAGR
jgi:poly(3-hydroxybutyrate) depolymerase